MKKLLFLLVLPFFISCTKTIPMPNNIPMPNKKCIDKQKFEVVTVLENRCALASYCTGYYSIFDSKYHSHCDFFYLTPQSGVDYYDGMDVYPPENKCAVQSGVYREKKKDNSTLTLPIIRWGYKYEARNEEEQVKRFKELIDEGIDECKQAYALDTDTPENMKKCESFVKERIVNTGCKTSENIKECECFFKGLIDTSLKGETSSLSEIEKKCSNNKINDEEQKSQD